MLVGKLIEASVGVMILQIIIHYGIPNKILKDKSYQGLMIPMASNVSDDGNGCFSHVRTYVFLLYMNPK